MVNRYVRDDQGGFVRQSVPEQPEESSPTWAPPPQQPPPDRFGGIGQILERFLPKNLETGDLLVLIVVLLLVLEREDNEDLLPLLITTASFLLLR